MPKSSSSPPAEPAAPAAETLPQTLHLFDAHGVEVEYMLVDAETLDVAPAADELLEAVAGEVVEEFANGDVMWNNELALHVLELNCNGPRRSLAGLGRAFAENVALANSKLAAAGRRLLGTAMHPWMDPDKVVLWPHGAHQLYDAFDRIFSCKGHGWANLQSMHINLPFAGDEEFARLHSAIRFLLPILPGLAASSPIIDGLPNGILDNRFLVYRDNRALRAHGHRDPGARRAGDAADGRRVRRADRRRAQGPLRRALGRSSRARQVANGRARRAARAHRAPRRGRRDHRAPLLGRARLQGRQHRRQGALGASDRRCGGARHARS